jgi:predicted nucleotidyltransferase
MQIQESVKQRMIDVCKHYRVKELHLFGSALSENLEEITDIDLLVTFERDGFKGAFDQFMGFKEAMEEVFGKPVDLLTSKKFRNPVFHEELEATKELIYAA